MSDTTIQEIRFTNPRAWSAAFDLLLEHPATQLCVAQRRDLTLRVRTADPRTLDLDGRIRESLLPEAS